MSATPDPDKNLQRAIDRLHQAAAKGANIVCLPELFQTQYFCQREDAALFDLAESIPGRTTSQLAETAKLLHIVVIASLFEKRAPGVYHNTAVMIDADGTLRGIYRKMHIPDDPLYYEKYYFTPGDLGFKAFNTQLGRAGSFVADPFGRVIAKASHDKEEILIAEVDPPLLEDTRRNWPFLRDRRIDAYGAITSRLID